MIGNQINQYKILEKLGEGGMGVVYKAEDTKLKRMVALKFLPRSSGENEEAKNRFINEARAASALDHPNICTLHEIGDTKDGQMYMTMAYYGGQSLKDKVEEGPVPVAEAVDIAIQTGRGLARAHEENITHRDIKPANIMVTERGEVKIVDFGLAKLAAVTNLTKSGMTLGTISYMSPEQAQGIAVDHRTDIWSLGVVLYEMLTGEQPFKGDHDLAVVYSLINEKHEPLTQIASDAPKDLGIIIDHALAKKPEDRYQTAEEMLADLLVVSKNMEAVTTGQKPAHLKVRRHSHRKPTLAAILIASFLVLAVSLWFFFVRGKPTDERNTVSLAVLPLKGFGEEVSEDWFRDSMTDALITDLTKVGGLRVISQNSAMQYKDSPKSIPEIAGELQVEYVIDASIVKVGEQIRLSAKLVNASANENIWAENFQLGFQNILTVQAEFAQAIAKQVKIELTPAEVERFENIHEVNPGAHEAYLKGRFFYSKGPRKEDTIKAIEHFHTAIRLDPDYAAAYAGLADALVYAASLADMIAPQEGRKQAKDAALHALQLDSTSAEAYTSLGFISLMYTSNWQAAEDNLKRAVSLNPSNTEAYRWYSMYLTTQGRHEEAISVIKRAVQRDPLSAEVNRFVGLNYYFARDYEQAISSLQKALDLHPDDWEALYFLAITYSELQQYDSAFENTRRGLELNPDHGGLKNSLGYLYAVSGKKKEAMKILDELPNAGPTIFIGLGKTDKAFESLARSLENQQTMILLKVAPWFDPLRSDPRFAELLRKYGLDN